MFEDSFFPGTQAHDEEFAELIERAQQDEPRDMLDLTEALKQLDSDGWGEDAILAIASAESGQIAEVLSEENRNWRRCVRTLSTYSIHGAVGAAARANFLLALQQIASTSNLNADRVRNKLRGLDLEKAVAEISESRR